MLRQIDGLEQGLYSGMLDVKKTVQQLSEMKKAGGFVKPVDPVWAAYHRGFHKAWDSTGARLELMLGGGVEITVGQSMMLRYRRKLKEALARLQNHEAVPEVYVVKIEDLMKQ